MEMRNSEFGIHGVREFNSRLLFLGDRLAVNRYDIHPNRRRATAAGKFFSNLYFPLSTLSRNLECANSIPAFCF